MLRKWEWNSGNIHLQQDLGGKKNRILSPNHCVWNCKWIPFQEVIETTGSPVAVGWSVLYTEHNELMRSHDSAVPPFITVSHSRIHYLPSSTPSAAGWEAKARRGWEHLQKDWFWWKVSRTVAARLSTVSWFEDSLHTAAVMLHDVHLLKLHSKWFTNTWEIFSQMQQVCCNPHIKAPWLLCYLQNVAIPSASVWKNRELHEMDRGKKKGAEKRERVHVFS